jgi:uncharacterized protein (DUF4415 family)
MKKREKSPGTKFEPRELTANERAELMRLAKQPDSAIDYSDIPRTGREDWRGAEVGTFYRPLKRQLTLRIDADVLDWFRREADDGRGYQTRINRALREYVAIRKKAG